ncbi:MAG: hypothetical protein ACFFC3_08300, partial [Candidatus Odinarchaeota archaeon]
KSGAKLGKLYKKKGVSLDIGNTLKQAYSVINGKPIINQIDENTYEVIIKYRKKFCPIGGSYDPSRAPIFQENICIPYTRGFLNELFPQFITKSKILKCILQNNNRSCHYILKLKRKETNG